MNIVPVTDRPNAAANRADDPKAMTRPTHATIKLQLINGT